MKARTKITIWTSSFTLLVAIVFSFFSLREIAEQPLYLIDGDLQDIRDIVIERLNAESHDTGPVAVLSRYPFNRYYIKVIDADNRIRMQSTMASQIDLPLQGKGRFSFVKKEMSLEYLGLTEDDRQELAEAQQKEVPFRVLREGAVIRKQNYTLYVARPVPIFKLEMNELITGSLMGAGLATMLVIIASYSLSGGILKPLVRINAMIREISEVSLYKRLPVGKNHDELHTLSESLNKMFDRLQFSFDRQKEYIGSASHELKTPLTVLMLGHEKILQEELPENARSIIEKQLDTLHRLNKMVRNLLEISRLEQHESFTPEIVDLNPLILHVLEEFEDILVSRDITVHTALEQSVIWGDREKMLQMLINLLDNAIKYNLPEVGQIWLATRPVQDMVEFSIANTGKIIPKESLEKIFEQFYRVEQSRALQFGGAGLGLAIVQQIVRLHNGSIVASHKSAEINQFLVLLPTGEG